MLLPTTTFVILAAIVLSGLGVPTAANADQRESRDQTANAKAAVTEADQRLRRATELSTQGAVPESKVHRAEIDLAEARIRFAAIQGQQQELVGNLEKVVVHWEGFWDRVKRLSEQGATPTRSANEARVKLAEARARLEAHRIVLVREQHLRESVEAAQVGATPQRRA